MSTAVDNKVKPAVGRSSLDSSLTEPVVNVRVSVPLSLYRAFETIAASSGLTTEDVIRRELGSGTAGRPGEGGDASPRESGRSVTLSPEQRQAVEKAFSRPFQDGTELAHFLLQVYSVQLNGESVPLSPDLLRRMDGRRGRIPLNKFVIETAVQQLEHFAGMR